MKKVYSSVYINRKKFITSNGQNKKQICIGISYIVNRNSILVELIVLCNDKIEFRYEILSCADDVYCKRFFRILMYFYNSLKYFNKALKLVLGEMLNADTKKNHMVFHRRFINY